MSSTATDKAPKRASAGASPKEHRRRYQVLAALGLLAAMLGIVGHVWYWYLPRERSARPEVDDAAYRLLEDSGHRWRVWLPFPHQNLGALERSLPQDADLAASRFPRFGGFRVPPSRELTLAWTPATSGEPERWQVAARIYPLIAALSRASGKLAGNAWLGGGRIPLGALGGDLEGRVRWRGTLWTFESGPEPTGDSQGLGPESRQPDPAVRGWKPPDSLLALASSEPVAWIGRGVFGLTRVESPSHPTAFQLTSWSGQPQPEGGSESLPQALQELSALDSLDETPFDDIAMLALERTAEVSRALVLLGPRGARIRGQIDVPSTVALSSTVSPGIARSLSGRAADPALTGWGLPTARIQRVLGLASLHLKTEQLWLEASDRRALELGETVALSLQHIGTTGTSERLGLVRIDWTLLGNLARDLAEGLAESPLVKRSEIEPWRQLAGFSETLSHLGVLRLMAVDDTLLLALEEELP